MLALVRTSTGSPPFGIIFIGVRNIYLHQEPNPVLCDIVPVKSYRVKMKNMRTSHKSANGYICNSVPYTPLPGCFLILNIRKYSSYLRSLVVKALGQYPR